MKGSWRPIMAPSWVAGRPVTAESVVTGTPSAPKATGAVSKIRVKTMASEALNPSMIRSALMIATGVPKPATPSSRAPKQNPSTISTTRRSSGSEPTTQRRNASKRPDFTEMLYRIKALNAIHITGQTAKVAPAAMLFSAISGGHFQISTASSRAAPMPADEACQAGRLSMPRRTSTTMIGIAATPNERTRLLATGVTSWWNMPSSFLSRAAARSV